MAGFPTCIIILCLFCMLTVSTTTTTVSAASGAPKELVSALGGSVTFPLNFTVKQIDTIVWTFNTLSLVTIQPAMGGKPATVIVTQNHNKERIVFPDGGYSLELSKLKKNDSGVYRAEIHSSSSRSPITHVYVLRVYEHLSMPKVTIGLQDNKNGTCITNLTCSTEQGGENVTYSWKAIGQASNESHDGSILPISWSPGEKNMTFICMARNPISSNSSSPIFAWKLCRGAAGDPDSSMVFLYLLMVPILICLLVLMPVLWLVQRERGKVSEPTEDKKRMDIHQEIPNFCLPSGENAEYDTILYTNKLVTSGAPGSDSTSTTYAKTNPEEDQANTLYATVQMPKTVKSPCFLPASPDTRCVGSFENII